MVNKYLVVCMSVEAECSFDKIRPLAISNVIKIGCGQFEKSKPAGQGAKGKDLKEIAAGVHWERMKGQCWVVLEREEEIWQATR